MKTTLYIQQYLQSLIAKFPYMEQVWKPQRSLRSIYLCLVMLVIFQSAEAQLINVPVTGFNSDQVANGIGSPTISTSAATDLGVDNGGFVFVDGTYQFTGACAAPTANIYPASGLVNSTAASGLVYNLQPASGNNALRIPALGAAASSGTLTVTTPVRASTVYLLCVSGGGQILNGINVTLNFTDLTSQTVSNITAEDWCNTTGNGSYTKITTPQYLRVQAASATCGSQATCQYFAELAVAVNPANFGKQIASITIAKTIASNIFNVYAVGIKQPCTVPTAQATGFLTGSITTGSIAASFTAASPAPVGTGGYLVVRYPQGQSPVNPSNGTAYGVNQALGNGTVVSVSNSTSFTAGGLSGGVTYDFYVYTYNFNTDCGGPIYNTVAPLTGSATTAACSGALSGTIMIGPGLLNTPASGYTSITNALLEINANGLGGNTILELQPGYDGTTANETFPLTFLTNPCIGQLRTLTIRPAASVTDTLDIISNNAGGATINLNGMSYVTIDGRPGGVGTDRFISITNTNASGTAIQFINDASNNTITYCDIKGQNTSATSSALSGVIYFSTASATLQNGNDNNTISFCSVHSTAGGFPAIGICSFGSVTSTSSWNDNNTITNCDIYDFYAPAVATTGIKLENGSNAFTISNNRFYQTAPRNYTTGAAHRILWLTPATVNASSPAGFQVLNNFIGGNNASGTGMYSLTGTGVFFWGMDINHWGTIPSSVQGNTITNISVASTITGTTNDFFRGISTGSAGNVNIGTTTGNTIGSGTIDRSIILSTTGTGTNAYGIKNGSASNSTDTINIYNNIIGGITDSSTIATNTAFFYGVGVITGSFTNIVNNVIGSTTVANSITLPNPATGIQSLFGIHIATAIANHIATITGNTIANLNNGCVGTTTNSTRGINLLSSVRSVISGNTVFNLRSASLSTGSATTATLIGIMVSTANVATVSNNTVHSLVLSNLTSTAASFIEGIFIFTNGTSPTHAISKNLIHSFDVLSSTNSSATLVGIDIAAGSNIVSNNMIRLGIKPDGTDLVNALTIRGIFLNSAVATNVYHNTVYIGGSNVGSTVRNTMAFQRNATGTHDIRNNIFVNSRSNSTLGTGGKHYQLFLNATTSVVVNNNVYYGVGNDVKFATLNGGVSDVNNYTLNWVSGDVGSSDLNPQLNVPTGSALTVDLHIHPTNPSSAESGGIIIASITDDIDGNIRSVNTPTDIGADAGNFVGINMVVDSTIAIQASTASAKIGTTNQAIIGIQVYTRNGANPIRVTSFDLNTASTSNNLDIEDAKIFYTGTQNAFDTLVRYGSILNSIPSGSFSVTGDTTLVPGINYFWLTYNVKSAATTGNIIDASLDGMALSGAVSPNILVGDPSGSRTIRGPLNGNYTIGVGQNYTTLTAAFVDLKTLGVSGPVTLTLKDVLYNAASGEVFPITANAITGASALNTITIVPDATVAARIESNSTVATLDLNGVAYVVVDGRQGGVGGFVAGNNLQVVNTGTIAPAVRFINEATRNILRYVDLRSNNTTATATSGAGVVNFGTTTGLNGNDTNIIEYCDIHEDGAGFPLIGISAIGSATTVATNNDANTVNNCNIYNFFSATLASAGIYIGSNNGNWSITNNRFYQTATRNYTSALSHRVLWITPNTAALTSASGYTISNNYIGGNSAAGTGTYTMTGAVNYLFFAMDISVGLGAVTNIQGNTITNLNMTGSNAGSAMHGINIANGNIECGTLAGNIFGSTTTYGAIQYISNSSTGSVLPYRIGGGSSVIFKRNIASGITLSGSTSSVAVSLFGINLSGGTIVVADSNLVGHPAMPNGIRFGTNTSATASVFVGIISNPGAVTSHDVRYNHIVNVNNAYSGPSTAASVRSIHVQPSSTGVFNVIGNIVEQIRDSATSIGTGANSAMHGIIVTTTTATAVTVSQNIVRSLVLTSPTAAVLANGIYYAGSATGNNIISRNLIHSLSLEASNPAAIITGIDHNSGLVTIANNMVRLGIDSAGNTTLVPQVIRGINKSATSNARILFNTVFIGGTGVDAGLNRTYAFGRTATGVDTVRNNVFVNQRSNLTTGNGGHFAVSLNNNTSLAMDYNLLQADSIGLFNNLALFSLNNWKGSSGLDANSVSGNPELIAPNGSTASIDLHVSNITPTPVEGGGTSVSGFGLDVDFDGETRSGLTPTDLGADAGNFVPRDIAPPTISLTLLTNTTTTGDRTVTASISDVSSIYVTGAFRPRIYFKKMAAGSYVSTQGSFVSGNASSSVWEFTISAGALGGLNVADSVYYFVVAQDSSALNNVGSFPGGVEASDVNSVTNPPAVPGRYWIAPALAGTYTVGNTVACNYSSITQAINLIGASIVTGPVVLELMDPVYDKTTETFPLVFTSALGFDAVKTLTIRPGSGVTTIIRDSITHTIIDLNGIDYMTIDGRQGGTGNPYSLTIQNRSISNIGYGTAAIPTNNPNAVRYINGATYNTIRYVNLEGAAQTNLSGVVFFSIGATEGNSYNTIDTCNIGNVNGLLNPHNIFVGLGTVTDSTKYNRFNNITRNSIYNFYSATAESNGFKVSKGNSDWTISNNHFFQTAALTGTGGTQYIMNLNRRVFANGATDDAFAFASLQNMVITNNYIGGSAPYASGSAWSITGAGPNFSGIYGEYGTSGRGRVSGNTLADFEMNQNATGNRWVGISVFSGLTNVDSNTIGSMSGLNSIVLTSTTNGASIVGIATNYNALSTPVGTTRIRYNQLGGIAVNGNTAASVSFTGINIGNTSSNVQTYEIDNNTIGNPLADNIITSGASTSATTQNMVAINATNGANVIVRNNLIQNMTNTYAGTASSINHGIAYTAGTGTISNNTITNLVSNAAQTNASTTNLVSVVGIQSSAASAGHVISGNTIRNLMNTNTGSVNTGIVGINTNGMGSGEIRANTVYGLNTLSTSSGAYMFGISTNSTTNIRSYNNMISLGLDTTNTAITLAPTIAGIFKANSGSLTVLHNTILIQGSGVGTGLGNTYAYRRTTDGVFDSLVNNIFVNQRSNATTGGGHYALYLNGSGALVSRKNVYSVAAVVGDTLISSAGLPYTTLPAWQTFSSLDLGSVDTVIAFAGVNNLHLSPAYYGVQSLIGAVVSGVTTDIDNELRSSSTPYIGADEVPGFPLPVTLLTFNGKASGADVVLNWTTALEVNNKGFQVERSIDGSIFKSIGFMEGTNTSRVQSYTLVDRQAFSSANAPVLYYRLKQVDNNGKFAYSNMVRVVNVKQQSGTLALVYPNPFVSYVNIVLEAESNTEASIEVADLNGKVMTSKEVKLNVGQNKISVSEVEGNPAGIYILTIRVNGSVNRYKLMKN